MTEAHRGGELERGEAAATPRRPRVGVLVAAGLAAIVACYLPAQAGPLIWDDRQLIADNPATRELQPLDRYFTSTFWQPTPDRPTNTGYYRPLVALSYALQYRLHGDATPGFHLFNLGLHLSVAVLLYRLARRIGATEWAALLAMTAWALLPRLTECTAWISGRTDLMAAAAALGALLVWEGDSRPRRWAAGGLLLAGLLSKEVALAALPAILAWELWQRGRTWAALRATAVRLAPLVAAVAAWAALRSLALQGGAPVPAPEAPSVGERLVRALDALGTYGLMVVDFLRPASMIGVAGRTTPSHVALGAVLAGCLLALAVVCWRRASPGVAMGLALGGAALVPVLHLVRIQVMVVAADRFLYLPLAGVALALAKAAGGLGPRGRRVAGAAAAAVAVAAAPVTYARSADYGDEARFWLAGLAGAPRELAIPHAQLGAMFFRAGRFAAAAKTYHRGLENMREASYYNPALVGVLQVGVALSLAQLEKPEAALGAVDELVAEQPAVPSHRFNRAQIRLIALDWPGGQADLQEALRLFPGFERARELQRIAQAAERAWASLPPDRPDLEAGALAARAGILARLGAWTAAGRLWLRVLQAPDASAADFRSAAIYLVRHGPVERARQAARAYAEARAPDAPLVGELLEVRLAALAELDAVEQALRL